MTKGNLQNIKSNLNNSGIFSELDIHFARFIQRFSVDRVLPSVGIVGDAGSRDDNCRLPV